MKSVPVWSPDGQRLTYGCNRSGLFRPLVRLASGLGSAESLTVTSRIPGAVVEGIDWSRDGKRLALGVLSQSWDIWTCSIDASTTSAKALLQTTFNERFPQFSPDARLDRVSVERVRSARGLRPGAGRGRREVADLGEWRPALPAGARTARRSSSRARPDLMAVEVHPAQTFQSGVPAVLFRVPLADRAIHGLPLGAHGGRSSAST